MGPNGSGQVHAGQHPAGQPRVRGHRRPGAVPGRRHHRLAHRGAGQGRHVPRLPVPPGDRRRLGHPVPPPGPVGPQGHRPVGPRAAPGHHGVDEAARHGPGVRRPLPQRGLLGRREEAQRDPADGHPRARAGHPRRDRLRPRHRRPAHGRQGHQRGPHGPPRAGHRAHHPLPAAAQRAAARPRPHPDRRPHRRQRRPRAGRAARARRLRGVARSSRDMAGPRRRPASARTSRSSTG